MGQIELFLSTRKGAVVKDSSFCGSFGVVRLPKLRTNAILGYLQDSRGLAASAVLSGSQPMPSVGRHLLGQKGTCEPLHRLRPAAVYYGKRSTANDEFIRLNTSNPGPDGFSFLS